MDLYAILIPPSLEQKQALRLRRLGLAALMYLLTIGLLSIAWWFGVLTAAAAVRVTIAYLVINLGMYAVIRSGANLRFKDPSLTLFQMLVAITVVMYITYHIDEGRGIALFGCFLVFLFGTFHLNTRDFAVATIYTLATYALVIVLMTNWRPEIIQNVRTEWMSWLILAGFLPCFSIVGGQINDLRRKSRARAEELRLFTDNVPAMTVSYDEHLHCRFVNKQFAEFFGLTVDKALGRHVREVIGEEAYLTIEGYYAEVMKGQPVTYCRAHRLPSGELRHLEIRLLPHISGNGKCLGCFSVAADITEHKLTEERIQRVAHHDSLTDLPNRLLFNDRLNQAIHLAKRDSSQFALLYIDLDRFKAVNDSLGHTAGDEVLKVAAARIRDQVRESDTVARVGGDEFTVILSDVTRREDAEAVAEKVLSAFATPFQLQSGGLSVEVGASIGIAIYPGDGQDANALVHVADTAMYAAKKARTPSDGSNSS